jgi:DNA polymerase III delta subunit
LETIDISTPFESEMTQWIKIFAEELNLNINNAYSSKLIETFGNNFSAIYNEMSKSSLSIEKEDDLIHLLNQSSSVKKDKQLWELNYAICDRRVDAIFENGLSILNQYGLSYLINSMFTIIEAIFLTKKNNGTLLESTSRNIRGKVINRISAASSNYSLKELENAIVIFSEIDIKLKTKKVIDEAEFTNIINGVFKSEG